MDDNNIHLQEEPEWKHAAVGNIVKERIDENGELKHGTREFSGGTKLYLEGKYWREGDKTICVIGLGRNGRYRLADVSVRHIENVRLQRVYRPAVLKFMDSFEFWQDWWHDKAEDRKAVKEFVRRWNSYAQNMSKSNESEAGNNAKCCRTRME